MSATTQMIKYTTVSLCFAVVDEEWAVAVLHSRCTQPHSHNRLRACAMRIKMSSSSLSQSKLKCLLGSRRWRMGCSCTPGQIRTAVRGRVRERSGYVHHPQLRGQTQVSVVNGGPCRIADHAILAHSLQGSAYFICRAYQRRLHELVSK